MIKKTILILFDITIPIFTIFLFYNAYYNNGNVVEGNFIKSLFILFADNFGDCQNNFLKIFQDTLKLKEYLPNESDFNIIFIELSKFDIFGVVKQICIILNRFFNLIILPFQFIFKFASYLIDYILQFRDFFIDLFRLLKQGSL